MDRAVFIRNEEGKVARVVGAMTDLTQQVEEEKQLKLYESVVTNTQESVVITEAKPTDIPGRKILYVNEAFTKLTGYTQDEVLGRSLGFLNGPKTSKETLGKLRNAIGNFEPVEVEFINYKKSGNEFWINTSMVPVSDSKGNYIHWVAIGRDVTARRNYEDEIQTSLAEKETLLAEIHHRVKNNLAVISGMMQLQAFESDNIDLQDKLFDSVSRIKTMATVHELLYQTNSFSNIDFSETLEYLIRSVSETLQGSEDIKVKIESESLQLNINQAIPVSLIVNEVLTNAYKHGFKNREEGKINIDFWEEEGQILLEIEDDGAGLPVDFDKNDLSSMGLKLIHVLSDQINAAYDFERLKKGTKFIFNFKKSDIRGIGNVYMS
jgi:PAS domain S-box-containing protein